MICVVTFAGAEYGPLGGREHMRHCEAQCSASIRATLVQGCF